MAQLSSASSLQADSLALAIISTRTTMHSCMSISVSSDEVQSILNRLRRQSSQFDKCTKKSGEMFQQSAWTAKTTSDFLNAIQSASDKATLEQLVSQLHEAIERTKHDILTVIKEIRNINVELNHITRDVSSLIASKESERRKAVRELEEAKQQQEKARRTVQEKKDKRDSAIGGAVVGSLLAAVLFPPAIPLIAVAGAATADVANDDAKDAKREVTRLQGVRDKLSNVIPKLQETKDQATQLQRALPTLLDNFQQVYSFWVAVDTAAKAVQLGGQSKLSYKQYAASWANLQRSLRTNADKLLTL